MSIDGDILHTWVINVLINSLIEDAIWSSTNIMISKGFIDFNEKISSFFNDLWNSLIFYVEKQRTEDSEAD